MEAIVAVIIIQAILSAILSAVIASSKGRDAAEWFMIGLFCGIFGLLAAIGVTKRESVSHAVVPAVKQKKCPVCAEMVLADAKMCRFCRHEFDITEEMRLQKEQEEEQERKDKLERETKQKAWELQKAKQKTRNIVTIVALVLFLIICLLVIYLFPAQH